MSVWRMVSFMTVATQSSSVRDRILKTAFDLFYRQGYRATGINQIIAESGVAKASFYDHFPSKDHLLAEYARETARREYEDMVNYVGTVRDPRKRLFAPLHSLLPWFEQTHFRGCPFQNLIAEVPVDVPAVQEVSKQHRENLRKLLQDLVEEVRRVEPSLAQLDVKDVVATYMLLLDGAIAVAVAYHDEWPVKQAMKSLRRYIGLKT